VARVFPQAAPLDRWINIEVPHFLTSQRVTVADAMHLVGAVVGALFTLAALAFLRAAGATRGALVAAAAVVLGGGYMLHFAGYDKFGPLLLGLAIASWGAVRLTRDGGGTWAFGAGIAVCLLAHRSAYALLPAAGTVFFQAWRRAASARARVHLALAAGLILAAALGLLPRTLHLMQSVDRLQALPGAPQGGGPAGVRGLADLLLRGGDALNLLFLVAPLWIAGAAGAWLARGAPASREASRFSLAPAALLALGGQLGLMLVARGAQGVSRDWDMHVGPAAVVTLISAAALISAWNRRGGARALAPTLTTALASAVALWGIHLSEPVAVARIGELLANRGAWSDAARARAHDFLGVRALQQHHPDIAIRELEAAIAAAPNPRFMFELGIAHRTLGRRPEAFAQFQRAHALDPGLADPWVGFALMAGDEGDYVLAVAFADSALRLAPHRTDAKSIRESALRGIETRAPRASP
jgi:tetratricopeptide (TPR) repeat protein